MSTKWTIALDTILLQAYNHVRDSREYNDGTTNGMKSKAWHAILAYCEELSNGDGSSWDISIDKMKNRYNILKKEFCEVKSLLSSGNSISPTGFVLLPPDLWHDLSAKKDKRAKWQTRPFPYWVLMNGKTTATATGAYAVPAPGTVPQQESGPASNDLPTVVFHEAVNVPSQPASDSKKRRMEIDNETIGALKEMRRNPSQEASKYYQDHPEVFGNISRVYGATAVKLWFADADYANIWLAEKTDADKKQMLRDVLPMKYPDLDDSDSEGEAM